MAEMEVLNEFYSKATEWTILYFRRYRRSTKKWNMSKEDYIKICIKNARKRAIQELKNAHEFKDVYDSFMQDENMTVEDFNKFLKEAGCKYDYDALMGAWDD